MAAARGGSLALVAVVALAAATSAAAASLWPLGGYVPCGRRALADELLLPSPSGGADMSYDSDAGLLWLSAGDTVYKTDYASGALLAGFRLQSSDGEPSDKVKSSK